MNENEISRIVVDAAVLIHRELGPGLLESVYEKVVIYELVSRGLQVSHQVPIQIEYKGKLFDEGFRADVIIENKVILELKSVETISDVHKKQLLTNLKLSGLRLGFVLNFGEAFMKDGIIRIVNGMPENN